MISEKQLENWFTYHDTQDTEVIATYTQIREAALNLARTIAQLTPESADQTAAIRKVREAVMTANAAIACSGN
jgi:hypothetical protein